MRQHQQLSPLSPSVTCSFAGPVPLQTSVKMTLNDKYIPRDFCCWQQLLFQFVLYWHLTKHNQTHTKETQTKKISSTAREKASCCKQPGCSPAGQGCSGLCWVALSPPVQVMWRTGDSCAVRLNLLAARVWVLTTSMASTCSGAKRD